MSDQEVTVKLALSPSSPKHVHVTLSSYAGHVASQPQQHVVPLDQLYERIEVLIAGFVRSACNNINTQSKQLRKVN